MLQGLLPRTQAQRPVANLQRPLDCCCHKSWQQLVAGSLPLFPFPYCLLPQLLTALSHKQFDWPFLEIYFQLATNLLIAASHKYLRALYDV